MPTKHELQIVKVLSELDRKIQNINHRKAEIVKHNPNLPVLRASIKTPIYFERD